MAQSKQKQVRLLRKIERKLSEEVRVTSLDQSLPKIHQIKSSIEDIENYVMKGKQVNVYPREQQKNGIKESFCQQLQKISNGGLVYVSDNLSVTANIETKKKPPEVLFDACLIMKGYPVFVLSIVMQDHAQNESVFRYNLSLTREVIDRMRSFMREPFSSLYGVLTDVQLKTKQDVINALQYIQKSTAYSCTPRSVMVSGDKMNITIFSLLSSIALTSSVDDADDSWWFLTLDQFVILTESIDQHEVVVRTKRSSGWSVLMREVAKRLEKSGPTLLVVDSEEQLQVARKMNTCYSMMTLNEWGFMVSERKPSEKLKNIVTNCETCPRPSEITGKSWTFVTDDTDDECETPKNEIPSLQTDERLSIISESSSFSERSADSGIVADENGSETAAGLRLPRKAFRKVIQKIKSQTKGQGNISFEEDGRKTPVRDPLIPIYITHEGPLYLLTSKLKRTIHLLCKQHKMSKDHINTEKCHMSEDGQLANGKAKSSGHHRFKEYWGTCSTNSIPHSTTPSWPKHAPPTPQYWGTATQVTGNWKREWRWRAVLEVALQEEDRLDSSVWVYGGPRSWCIRVGRCNTHVSSFCTQVWNQQEHVSCVIGTLSDAPDASKTLVFGVVVDVARGRLGFIDLEKGTILAKIDVKFLQALYPVFGVYAYALEDEATVMMRLISGCDIDMTDDKQKLIYSCLS